MADIEHMQGFEVGTAPGPVQLTPDELSKMMSSTELLSDDQPVYVEWRWRPEDFADRGGRLEFPVDQLIRSNDHGVRVRLWHDDEGCLHLRIGAWGEMFERTLRDPDA